MSKIADVQHHQTSFTSGILSGGLASRIDLGKYDAGVADLCNLIVHPEGGVSKRTGTELITFLGIDEESKIIPFIFNAEQSYILVFTDKQLKIIARSLDKWGFVLDAEGNVYSIQTPILSEFLSSLEYTQVHDVLMLCSSGMAPTKLVRKGHSNWVFEAFDFSKTFQKVTGVDATFIGTGLTGNEITLNYYVCAVDSLGDLGQMSDPKVVEIKALWAQGNAIKVSWKEVPNANGYNVYKSIGGRGLGYIGRATGISLIDDYITPDYTRSPDRSALSIIASNFNKSIIKNYSYSTSSFWVVSVKNIDLIDKQSSSKKISTVCANINFDPSQNSCIFTFSFIFSTDVKVSSIQINGSSDKKLFSKISSTFRVLVSCSGGNMQEITQASSELNFIKVIPSNIDTVIKKGTTFYVQFKTGSVGKFNLFISSIMVNYEVALDPEVKESGFIDLEYPNNITVHNQRLIFGNTPKNPVSIFASRTGLFYDFTIGDPIRDDDAIEASLSALQNDKIEHMVSLEDLFVFTRYGEYVLVGGQENPISPTNLMIKKIGNRGSYNLAPLVVGNEFIFLQRDGKTIRVMRYGESGFSSDSVNILCKELFDNRTIVSWCYQQEPDSIIWVVFDDGTFASLTYVKEHEVWAWSRHTTDGNVKQIVSIPVHEKDTCFMLVERMNGDVKYQALERMTHAGEGIYHDCALTQKFEEYTQNVSLDTFYDNQKLSVLADEEFYHGTCEDGICPLLCDAKEVSIGLPYESILETLGAEIRNMESMQGRKKRICAITLHLLDSRGNIEIETLNDRLKSGDEKSRSVVIKTLYDDSINKVPLLMNGYLDVLINGGYTLDGKVRIIHREALAFNLLGIIQHITVGDR